MPKSDYDSKDMQDWIAVLQGHCVPNSDPENRKFASAVRKGMLSLYPKTKILRPRLYDFELHGPIDDFNKNSKLINNYFGEEDDNNIGDC
jgi:hypothetical protein|tara:strand:+ start:2551 stop:2820 length:270 start_codon:yes stop_codon:yes gene_type:complete